MKKPDQWDGWRIVNGQINYSTTDPEYLESRKNYLQQFIWDYDNDRYTEESEKLWANRLNYSNRQILAWGCGSGKTLKLIVFGAQIAETALIVLNTNEEVDKLVFDIKALNPEQSIIGYHSNAESAIEVEKNPDYLTEFKVVVTNNWRFLNDPSHIFINCFANSKNTYFKILNKGVSYRQYIVFDEFPNFFNKYAVGSYCLVSAMTYLSGMYDSSIISTLTPEFKRNQFTSSQVNNLSKALNTDYKFLNIALGTNDEFISNLEKERKISKVVNAISRFIQDPFDYVTNPRIIEWIESIETIVDIGSKVFILDATGDIVFKGSKLWDIVKEYPFTANISEVNYIDMDLSRSRSRLSKAKHYERLLVQIDKLNAYLSDKLDRKHLIVAWKDTMGFNVPEIIKDKCKQGNYYVTYYGSGKTRGTNEFIDCDSVIFFGDWYVNQEMIKNLRKTTKSKVTSSDFVLAEMVQAIFRTRARNQKIEDNSIIVAIDPRFSETSDVGFNDLKTKLISTITGSTKSSINFHSRMRLAKTTLNKQSYEKLDSFFNHYSDYKKVFEEERTLVTTLTDLHRIIPYKVKEARSYDKLKEVLKRVFNINLIIQSNNTL